MKLICLGDSFTRGFGVKKKESWLAQLSLDLDNVEIINMGINGDTTSGMLARFNSDVVSHKPNYVLITGGTNDFISGSSCEIPQNNYMAMIHQAYHHGIIPIIGIEPAFSPSSIRNDWAMFSNFDSVLDKQLSLRDWLIRMSHTFGVFFIDFYESFFNETLYHPEKEYYIDGLHLTSEGHNIISEIAMKELNKILKR